MLNTIEQAKKAEAMTREYHELMLQEIANGSLDKAKEYKALRDEQAEYYDSLMASMGL